MCVSLLWDLLVGDYLLLVFLWVHLAFLGWGFLSSTFCRAGFVDMYCFNLVLSWNIFFSPSIVIKSFTGYSTIGLHPWSLSVCSTSVQDLLAFMVFIEKSGVVLIGLPLHVT